MFEISARGMGGGVTRLGLLALACVAVMQTVASAQDYRIYTLVYDSPVAGSNEPERLLSRNITIFHAGKSYDYIEEAQEVVICEQARNRFTLLNTSRRISTVLDFDVVRRLLSLSRAEAEKEIVRLEQTQIPGGEQAAQLLRFQLDPKFQVSLDRAKQQLVLAGPNMKYEVRTAEPAAKDITENYASYADWMSRLNHALHRGTFPEPRLKLNAELRKSQLVPVEVTLQIDGKRSVRRRAIHRIHWQLDAKDRSLIHAWETLLKSPTTQKVSRDEYQRLLIEDQTSRAGR